MKIFITGSTGLVGNHLVKYLAKEGHELFCLVRSMKKWNNIHFEGSVTPVLGDLAKSDWIDHLPKDLGGIVHVAGLVHSHDVGDFYRVNSQGTEKLITTLKSKYEKTPLHFTLISSLAAKGPDLNPVSDYGKSKRLAEEYLIAQAPSLWRTSIVRPPMVMGPHDEAFLEVFKMIQKGFMIIPGWHGDQKRYSFVSVHDLVQLIASVLLRPASTSDTSESSNIFYAAYPQEVTYRELYETIAETLGVQKLIELRVPSFFLPPVAGLITWAALRCKKLESIRLTSDKVKELLPDAWICPKSDDSPSSFEFEYQWDLLSTVKNTADSYFKANLLK